MDRSRALLLACLAVLSASPRVLRAEGSTEVQGAPSQTPAFNLDPLIRDWCPPNPSELSTIPVTPSDAMPSAQDVSHPAVPLPPALAGATALGVGWVMRRAWRGMRRQMRRGR